MDFNELQIEAKDLNQQGALLLKAGNIEAARKKFDQAIELDPMVVENYKNYGDLNMAEEKYQDAKNHYKKALLIEKSGLLYFLYGNACFMNDNVHEGLENYNMAISEGYDNEEMMFFMGMAYEHLNDDEMALRFFQKACVKNPSRADYLIKKISVLIRLQMLEKAELEIEELLKIAPEMFDGYHMKTLLLLNQERYEEAANFAKQASDKFPEDPELLYDYAKCITMTGNFDLAISLIESAKKMKYYTEAERMFTMLEAQIYAESKNMEAAIACCEACIAMEKDDDFDGEARFMLMNLNLVTENLELVLKQAVEIVNRDAEDLYYYAALYYKAFCMKKLGKEDAMECYKEANSIYRLATLENPGAVDIYLYRAMCMKDMEEYDKAMDILNFILDLDADVAEIHTIKAEIYQIQGKVSQSETELKLAYELKPELKPNESKGE